MQVIVTHLLVLIMVCKYLTTRAIVLMPWDSSKLNTYNSTHTMGCEYITRLIVVMYVPITRVILATHIGCKNRLIRLIVPTQ
jgi:hypothetical protein